jgi:hypothetical protein
MCRIRSVGRPAVPPALSSGQLAPSETISFPTLVCVERSEPTGSGAELMRWFEDLGITVTVEPIEGGGIWAHLRSSTSDELVGPRYARGDNAVLAFRNARRRYESEHK